MIVTISGLNSERKEQIIEAANQEWEFDDWYQERTIVSATAEGHLYGGEGEEEFTERLSKTIWKANGAFCPVSVQATYLDALPVEEHELTEEDYNNMSDEFRREVMASKPIALIEMKKMLLTENHGKLPDDYNVITEIKLSDNYTCGCGNTKCNTSEKSCWKCGTVIKS
jgi:hypothetical protein